MKVHSSQTTLQPPELEPASASASVPASAPTPEEEGALPAVRAEHPNDAVIRAQKKATAQHFAEKAFKESQAFKEWGDASTDRGRALDAFMRREVEVLTRRNDAGPLKPFRSSDSYGAGKAIKEFCSEPLKHEHRALLEQIEGDVDRAFVDFSLDKPSARALILAARMSHVVKGLSDGQLDKWMKRVTTDNYCAVVSRMSDMRGNGVDYRRVMADRLWPTMALVRAEHDRRAALPKRTEPAGATAPADPTALPDPAALGLREEQGLDYEQVTPKV
ncbi:hypothetical protein ACFJIX_07835 [Roseateles sp. UC29_93]|uniref:hypothetical protein n=1 Tax=Roseateles sp. UC29_93 TaxID=3350177 RepID=UPI003671B3B8